MGWGVAAVDAAGSEESDSHPLTSNASNAKGMNDGATPRWWVFVRDMAAMTTRAALACRPPLHANAQSEVTRVVVAGVLAPLGALACLGDHPAYARGRMGSGLADNPIPAEGLGVPPSVELIESLGLDLVSLEWWAADKSTVVFVRITDRLSLAVSQGPGHRDSLPFYSDQAPKTCANPGSVIFFDVGRLSSTDLRVVSTLLSVGKANRHNLAEVHMLYTSPLVGMAVTVGNIALSGLIRLYHEAEPFHAALRSACQIRTTLVSPA